MKLLEQMKLVVENSENIWLLKKLKEIQDVIDTTPNDFELGWKLRELL